MSCVALTRRDTHECMHTYSVHAHSPHYNNVLIVFIIYFKFILFVMEIMYSVDRYNELCMNYVLDTYIIIKIYSIMLHIVEYHCGECHIASSTSE